MQVVSRSRRLVAVLAVVSGLTLVAGCDVVSFGDADAAPAGRSSSAQPEAKDPTTTKEPAAAAVLQTTPADGTASVLPSTLVKVAVTGGDIDNVTVKDAKGKAVAGKVGTDGAWTATSRLAPSAAYTVVAAASNEDGQVTTSTSSFTTLKPKITATYSVLYGGQNVGVGAPATIQFDSAVTTKAMRAQVEKTVKITTSPVTRGSWGWLDDRQLMWRPSTYWKPGTKVAVSAPLTGVQTGPDKWVGNDDAANFTIGDSMISTVDIARHTMTVKRNGTVVRTMPISAGRPGPLTETRSGVKVIIAKEGTVVMDSATVGIPKGSPGYYRTIADSSLRVTWTGEYLHSAPWSVGSQGYSNVSHGCVNIAPGNASWMYQNSKVGDVVVFTGSGRQFKPTEGIGVWVYDFNGWKAQSALV